MNSVRNIIVWWRGALALFCGLLLLTGCETLSNQPQPTAAGPSVTSDTILMGEMLTIEFLDIPQPQKIDQTVREDGSISLILGQRAIAAGKTVVQLQNEIHDLYVPRYYTKLTVNIRREFRFYFVGGEVKNPSKQAYTGDMTVIKAIQSAGDFTVFANKKKIQIIRTNGKQDKVNYYDAIKNPKLDLPIYPGDRIIVPVSKW
jgi:protein involved in polysaccharide export with SLBB domain